MEKNKETKTSSDKSIYFGEEALKRYNELKAIGYIIFEAVVGSTAYGTNIATSDVDKKFIYIENIDNILTGNASTQLNISDDYVGYEVGRYMELLRKQNPNIIELINVSSEHILHCSPIFNTLVVKQRSHFLSKAASYSFGDYAKSQIKKAQGTNKKFMNPMEGPRKSLLEFAYVPMNHGSMPLSKFLRNLDEKDCGLVAIDHMRYTYHLYTPTQIQEPIKEENHFANFAKFIKNTLRIKKEIKESNNNLTSINNQEVRYSGILSSDGNQIKLSSVPKHTTPVAVVQFNMDGFSKYCEDYASYQKWKAERNEHRFAENLDNEHNYDRKNMMHCHRLFDMCIEILNGEGVKVLRPNREELLSIRNGNSTYKQLVDLADEKYNKVSVLRETSSLPEVCDKKMMDDVLLKLRKKYYAI